MPDTLPWLGVARDSSWHFYEVDSLQFGMWAPQNLPLDLRGVGAQCLPWNQQPLLYPDEGDTFVPVFFSRGSLGEALQAVDIGWNDNERSFVSYGRLGASNRLTTWWGARSVLFSGSRSVGVPISEDGPGMALDEVAVYVGVVRRPDGCWVILSFDEHADEIDEIDAWHMLEAVRFEGEDRERALPGQRFVSGFDFSQRARKVVVDSSGRICMVDPPPGIRPRTPVTTLREHFGVEIYPMSVAEGETGCGRGSVALLADDYNPPDEAFDGIGIILAGEIEMPGGMLTMDLDRNGRPETLISCMVGDSTEFRIVERAANVDSVRYRIRSAVRSNIQPCTS